MLGGGLGGGWGSAPVFAVMPSRLPRVKEIRHKSVLHFWRKRRVFTARTGADVCEFLASRTSVMEAWREKSTSVSQKKRKKTVRTRKAQIQFKDGISNRPLLQL